MTVEMDIEKLVGNYMREPTATEEQCDQAIYGLENAVDYLVEVMCRRNGVALLRRDITRILEAERKLCETITDITIKPYKESSDAGCSE